jgi:hypothetical protein
MYARRSFNQWTSKGGEYGRAADLSMTDARKVDRRNNVEDEMSGNKQHSREAMQL